MSFSPAITAPKNSSGGRQTFHIVDAFFGSLMFPALVFWATGKCST
jgi:hypothetical protein